MIAGSQEESILTIDYSRNYHKLFDLGAHENLLISLTAYDFYGKMYKVKKSWSKGIKLSLRNSTVNFLSQSSNVFGSLPNYIQTNSNQITLEVNKIYGDYEMMSIKTNDSKWIGIANYFTDKAVITIEDNFKSGPHDFSLKFLDKFQKDQITSKSTNVINESPILTGQDINLKYSGEQVTANYQNVFKNAKYFVISCGSIIGSTDILDFTETKQTEMIFIAKNVLKIYLNIFAVNERGLYTFKTASFIIS